MLTSGPSSGHLQKLGEHPRILRGPNGGVPKGAVMIRLGSLSHSQEAGEVLPGQVVEIRPINLVR